MVNFSGQEEYRNKCRFLYGESMGGAVALLLHKKDPAFWNGAVLVAPMCKVYICMYYVLCIMYIFHEINSSLVCLIKCQLVYVNV